MSTIHHPAPPSADPEEMAYYAALADRWWDASGPFWPLHRLNTVRTGYLRDRLCEHFRRDPRADHPLAGLGLLDIGCGGGILSESMAALGATVDGVDVVERNIAAARLHGQRNGSPVRYRTASAEALADRGEAYDVVLNMEVVEHVADLPGFLHACNRLVRPGGLQVIATINRTLLSWLVAIVGAEYVLGWLPKGTHRWRRFPRPEELDALLARDGLHVIHRSGVRVAPLTRRMSLTPFMGVNYMLVATKPGAS